MSKIVVQKIFAEILPGKKIRKNSALACFSVTSVARPLCLGVNNVINEGFKLPKGRQSIFTGAGVIEGKTLSQNTLLLKNIWLDCIDSFQPQFVNGHHLTQFSFENYMLR